MTGNTIRALRKAKGLTQKELGDLCGMADSAIRRYESNRANPTVETLQRIAGALGVSLAALLPKEPDREYEELCLVLAAAGISIEAAGWSEGPDGDGDHYYVWPENAEARAEVQKEYTFGALRSIVAEAQQSAEQRRLSYLRKRLDAELF